METWRETGMNFPHRQAGRGGGREGGREGKREGGGDVPNGGHGDVEGDRNKIPAEEEEVGELGDPATNTLREGREGGRDR